MTSRNNTGLVRTATNSGWNSRCQRGIIGVPQEARCDEYYFADSFNPVFMLYERGIRANC
jgi:hypothetical protein